jgi:hypothetical protein
MEERIVIIRGLKLKCLEDGSVFVWKDECHKGKLIEPYWRQVGSKEKQGYITYHSNISGAMKLHRIIAVAFLGLDIENLKDEIDHIDGNRSNNNVSNLRIVNHTQNCMNYQNKEIKGVLPREYGRWRAYINYNKARYSKTFKTKEEAIEWRREKEKEFGYLHTTCL